MQQRLGSDHLLLLVVDNIGTADSAMIGILDQHLRQLVFDPEMPLGGVHCLSAGDLWQLPSFNEIVLPKT